MKYSESLNKYIHKITTSINNIDFHDIPNFKLAKNYPNFHFILPKTCLLECSFIKKDTPFYTILEDQEHMYLIDAYTQNKQSLCIPLSEDNILFNVISSEVIFIPSIMILKAVFDIVPTTIEKLKFSFYLNNEEEDYYFLHNIKSKILDLCTCKIILHYKDGCISQHKGTVRNPLYSIPENVKRVIFLNAPELNLGLVFEAVEIMGFNSNLEVHKVEIILQDLAIKENLNKVNLLPNRFLVFNLFREGLSQFISDGETNFKLPTNNIPCYINYIEGTKEKLIENYYSLVDKLIHLESPSISKQHITTYCTLTDEEKEFREPIIEANITRGMNISVKALYEGKTEVKKEDINYLIWLTTSVTKYNFIEKIDKLFCFLTKQKESLLEYIFDYKYEHNNLLIYLKKEYSAPKYMYMINYIFKEMLSFLLYNMSGVILDIKCIILRHDEKYN
ncbi:hypothetical protein [Francisella frigiditurris]|uniref:Uncharacterized protein n=1 Tax=Francisella frigiditurris TaxID=1542390 RepID=A0A1J0KS55_9GAMM|nr:hypothetical protein [Francisella frigiditurris]APC96522.1 hypothetical protein KX01_1293 [Francisella frigiditurris]